MRATEIVCIIDCKNRMNSESDFQSLAESIGDSKFDYILCCKACGELWSSHIVGEPYMAVAELFSEKLKDYGAMLILDVASQPGGCPKYLPEEMNLTSRPYFISTAG